MTTAPAIPQTGDELEELFADGPRLQSALDGGSFPQLIRDYVAKFTGAAANTELLAQCAEQTQLGLFEFLRDQADRNGVRPPEGFRPGAALALAQGRGPRRARAIARSKMQDAADLFDRQGLFSDTAVGADKSIDEAGYADSLTKFLWASLKGVPA